MTMQKSCGSCGMMMDGNCSHPRCPGRKGTQMTDQKQAPERLVFKKEFFDMLDEQERNITGVYRIEDVEALAKQRDELAAEVNGLKVARDMMGRLWGKAKDERDQALAASAAREIAMRDRAAECEEEVGIAFGFCRDETGDEYNQGWIDCTEHWLDEIRALPLSPDGQQALDDVRADAWDEGCTSGFNTLGDHSYNPYRKTTNEGEA